MPSLLKNISIISRGRVSAIRHQISQVEPLLRAFPSANGYRVQIVGRTKAAMKQNYANVSAAALLDLVDTGKLAHSNVNGSCIFARPRRRDLILIDDLTPEAAAQLADRGFAPAAIIQSSPRKTNVILRIPNLDPNPSPEAAAAYDFHTEIQKRIVQHLQAVELPADAAASRDMQVWRLPGFSNQKRQPDNNAQLRYAPLFFARVTLLKPDAVAERGVEFVERLKMEREIEKESPVSKAQKFEVGKEFNFEAFDNEARSALRGLEARDKLQIKVIGSPADYLAVAFARVREEKEGKRRATLLATATMLFRFSAGAVGNAEYRKSAGLAPAELADRLCLAGIESGLEKEEVEHTVRWGMKYAEREPIFPEIPGLADSIAREGRNPWTDDFGQPRWPQFESLDNKNR
jgi:hypothetical protein